MKRNLSVLVNECLVLLKKIFLDDSRDKNISRGSVLCSILYCAATVFLHLDNQTTACGTKRLAPK